MAVRIPPHDFLVGASTATVVHTHKLIRELSVDNVKFYQAGATRVMVARYPDGRVRTERHSANHIMTITNASKADVERLLEGNNE